METLLVLYLQVFVTLLQLLKPEGKTEIRSATVCYNTNPCTDKYHTLTCETSKRIAVHHAVYGFKSADRCPVISDCKNATDTSCCNTDEHDDCQLAFHQQGIDQIVEDCYGQARCSFPSPTTEFESGSCAKSTVEVSSYSKLYYRCIAESTIADFCSIETVRGESTFSVYDPRRSSFKSGTCSCTVTSRDPQHKANIQVYGVYMRLNGTSAGSHCSKLSIYDQDTAYVFGCENDQRVEADEEKQEQSLLNTTTPITVRLSLTPMSLPRYVWIGFEANENSHLVLRCHADEDDSGGLFNRLVGDVDGIDPDFVAAILFGVLIIVVVLSITLAGFPWYMRKLAMEIEAQSRNGVVTSGPNGATKTRRSSRDPKIYVEMEDALNEEAVTNGIPLTTIPPYYSDTYNPKQHGKRKSEPKAVPAPGIPKPLEILQQGQENTCYLGMDSPQSSCQGSPLPARPASDTDSASMVYSEPYAMMSSCSSFKEDNYNSPSLASTLTLGSTLADSAENRYEAAFGNESKDHLRRPDEHIDMEDEYLLPVSPDVSQNRRASENSLQYEAIPIPNQAQDSRRRSLSYFVNQAFDVNERPPLPPPLMSREPLPDKKPLVVHDEMSEDDGQAAQADSNFANSEYFM